MQSVAWCATAALMGVAVAAPAPLGLTEAQQLAVERSRQMTAYDSAIAAARDIAVAAAQLPEPTLGVAQQPMSREKREARAERYAREADRVAAQKIATRVEIAREAALAWFDCYYVEQMTRIAADQLKFAEVEVEGAERMYWAGRLPQAEFYATRTMLVMFEDKSSELEHRGRATRIALKRWVGDAGDAPLAALPNIDRIGLTPAGLEGDFVRHPEVALLQKQEDIAASDVRVAQADRQSAPEIAATLAKRDESRAARDEKLRAEVAQTRIIIDQWQHARDRRDRYARQLVPLARERTQATLVAYRGGKGTLTDVLAARRAETEAQMQSVEMGREVARLWARINFALPELLPTTQRGSSREERAQ
ncbi:MAG TPA: TolC family protein [Casimicrobiaceae bacterium]|nr:TolC family protein [Casimicrobiaceae bacterium]